MHVCVLITSLINTYMYTCTQNYRTLYMHLMLYICIVDINSIYYFR